MSYQQIAPVASDMAQYKFVKCGKPEKHFRTCCVFHRLWSHIFNNSKLHTPYNREAAEVNFSWETLPWLGDIFAVC